MKRTGCVILILISALVSAAGEPAPSLDDLLKEYKSLGLPFPPDDALLVCSAVQVDPQDKNRKPGFELEFVLKSKTAPKWSLDRYEVFESAGQLAFRSQARRVEVSPAPACAENLRMASSEKLIVAIRCRARGWDKLASVLFEQSQKEAKVSPHKVLNDMAWYYWRRQIAKPKSDRAVVAKRLEELMARNSERQTKENKELLRRLDLALIPSKAKPGSVDALIDELIDIKDPVGWFDYMITGGEDDFDGETGFHHIPPPLRRIAALGFDAVPALIEHLDDERLTRGDRVWAVNMSWGQENECVNHYASNFLYFLGGADLQAIAGDDEWPLKKETARKWFEKARTIGEFEYVMQNLIREVKNPDAEFAMLDKQILFLILSKYPAQIPGIYRRVIDKYSSIYTPILVWCIERCQIPEQEKLALFVEGAKHKRIDDRLAALDGIRKLDKPRFKSHLISEIEKAPGDIKEEESSFLWHLTKLVIDGDAPDVWLALEKLARRAETRTRIRVLDLIGYRPAPTSAVPSRIRFLLKFLDDASLPSEKDAVEVRNNVALQIAMILDEDVDLEASRTPEEWRKFRDQMRAVATSVLDKR